MTRAKTKVVSEEMPAFVAPCLARLATGAPSGDNWVHEIKFDGYRLQARIENGKVQLLTRNGHDWTDRFAVLVKALGNLDVKTAILDGEAVVENEQGASDFSMLVRDLKAGHSARIVYCAFDLLFLNGRDTMPLSLVERKALLERTLKRSANVKRVRLSEHIVGNGAAMLTESCKLGLEGIISKQTDKPYRSGRRGDWTKSKCTLTDEFVVVGYLNSKAVENAIGALVLGFYDGKSLVYAGRVGTGFSRRAAGALWLDLQKLRVETSKLATRLDATQRRDVIFVKPKIVAQIEYRAWTEDGLLRHASFKGLRKDKPSTQVNRPY